MDKTKNVESFLIGSINKSYEQIEKELLAGKTPEEIQAEIKCKITLVQRPSLSPEQQS